MRLASRQWQQIVTTSSDELMRDYFVPALLMSKAYDRGVGYFSSGWLQAASEGLIDFAARAGTARWVTSPILSQTDWDALRTGYEARINDVLYQAIVRSIDAVAATLRTETASALAWMIADGILSFKLAVPRGRLDGEFHDKFGIFTDEDGNHLAFRGSYNESIQGLHNYESISFYPSWQPVLEEFCKHEVARFNTLWKDNDPNLRAYDIPEAAKAQILKLRTNNRPYDTKLWSFAPAANHKRTFAPPDGIELRDYQRAAANAWFQNNGRGILMIATGGGKTLTSLFMAHALWKNHGRLVVLVTSPYIVLTQQWQKEMRRFGLDPVVCYGTQDSWKPHLEQAISAFTAGVTNVVAVSVTNSTFRNPVFQQILARQAQQTLLIADEVHNAGAEQFRRAANHIIPYRLGLSATPERRFDDEGNTFIQTYFGKVVFEFDIKDAISAGVLTPYFYHPVLVDLTEEEAEEYLDLTAKIGRLSAFAGSDEGDSDESQSLKRLLIKRSRLIANARGKLPKLSELVAGLDGPVSRALVYCGDGSVDKPDQTTLRQVAEACRILGIDHDLRVRQYTADEPPEERTAIISDFEQGTLDAIVAIKCLDEGVDIPVATTGFILASSSNPRQYVQRRGRLLRKAPGKEHSVIYDFIVIPPDLGGEEDDVVYNTERKLFKRELLRISEFCNTAENGGQALHTLQPLRKKYNLLAGASNE